MNEQGVSRSGSRKERKVFYAGLFIGILLGIVAYLRYRFDLWPSETLDSLVWLLAGPLSYAAIRFNLPDFISLFTLIAYYALLGLVFQRLSSRLRHKPLFIPALILTVLGLGLLHWFTAKLAANILGRIIFNGIWSAFSSLWGIR
jgi:hypothetical protein